VYTTQFAVIGSSESSHRISVVAFLKHLPETSGVGGAVGSILVCLNSISHGMNVHSKSPRHVFQRSQRNFRVHDRSSCLCPAAAAPEDRSDVPFLHRDERGGWCWSCDVGICIPRLPGERVFFSIRLSRAESTLILRVVEELLVEYDGKNEIRRGAEDLGQGKYLPFCKDLRD